MDRLFSDFNVVSACAFYRRFRRCAAFSAFSDGFFVGSIVGFIALIFRGVSPKSMLTEPKAMVVGILGLFGYHFLYFTALRNAPEIEAGLIAYLWPLFIVLGSALMPGERLGLHHIIGALTGAFGALLIVTKGQGFDFDARYAFGYAMAFLCALTDGRLIPFYRGVSQKCQQMPLPCFALWQQSSHSYVI